jgi:hypothetical protein
MVCTKFQLDPSREAEIQKALNRKKSDVEQVPADMDESLKKWGIGLIILGVIHILATQFLDPIWGGIIIILGILNLVIKKRGMFIANGIALLLVGFLNIVSGLVDEPVNFFWSFFGAAQLFWGIKEIRKYKFYEKEDIPKQNKIIEDMSTTSFQTSDLFQSKLKHSGFGIASFSISCIAFILIILIFVVSVYLNIVNPDAFDEEGPGVIFIGAIMVLDIFLVLIGTGLGITGILEKGKRKVFSVLGLVFNGVFLVLLVLSFIPE